MAQVRPQQLFNHGVTHLCQAGQSRQDQADGSGPRLARGRQPSRNRAPGRTIRLATCPQCGHQGALPRSAPTTATVRCSACGSRFQIRHVVGDRPCRPPRLHGERAFKARAAADLIERLGYPGLDDQVDDLFRGPPADPASAGTVAEASQPTPEPSRSSLPADNSTHKISPRGDE
jgi:hypothetical protein